MTALSCERVLRVHHWNEKLFSFTTSRSPGLRFENGQFLMIGLNVDERPLLRAYSIASANHEEHLEFFSIKVPAGRLTSRLQQIEAGHESWSAAVRRCSSRPGRCSMGAASTSRRTSALRATTSSSVRSWSADGAVVFDAPHRLLGRAGFLTHPNRVQPTRPLNPPCIRQENFLPLHPPAGGAIRPERCAKRLFLAF